MPGAGKTTIAKMLEKELGLKFYYMGAVMRDIARRKGITLNELAALRKAGPEIDKEVDDYLVNLGKTQDNLVIDSRTAAHFIPHSIKIFFAVDVKVGAERVMKDLIEKGQMETRNEQAGTSIEEQITLIKERMSSERQIYQKLYGFDLYGKERYDLWLDTTELTLDQVFQKVLDFIKSQSESKQES
jgi:cytidylate kinase